MPAAKVGNELNRQLVTIRSISPERQWQPILLLRYRSRPNVTTLILFHCRNTFDIGSFTSHFTFILFACLLLLGKRRTWSCVFGYKTTGVALLALTFTLARSFTLSSNTQVHNFFCFWHSVLHSLYSLDSFGSWCIDTQLVGPINHARILECGSRKCRTFSSSVVCRFSSFRCHCFLVNDCSPRKRHTLAPASHSLLSWRLYFSPSIVVYRCPNFAYSRSVASWTHRHSHKWLCVSFLSIITSHKRCRRSLCDFMSVQTLQDNLQALLSIQCTTTTCLSHWRRLWRKE